MSDRGIIEKLLHNMQRSTEDLKGAIRGKIQEAAETLPKYDRARVTVPLFIGAHSEKFISERARAAVDNVMKEINNGQQILFYADVEVNSRYGGTSVLNFSIEIHQTAKDEICHAIREGQNLEGLFETLPIKSAGKQG
jgi:hypothetical protein